MKIKDKNKFIEKENKQGIAYGKGVERKIENSGVEAKCEESEAKCTVECDADEICVEHNFDGTFFVSNHKPLYACCLCKNFIHHLLFFLWKYCVHRIQNR